MRPVINMDNSLGYRDGACTGHGIYRTLIFQVHRSTHLEFSPFPLRLPDTDFHLRDGLWKYALGRRVAVGMCWRYPLEIDRRPCTKGPRALRDFKLDLGPSQIQNTFHFDVWDLDNEVTGKK